MATKTFSSVEYLKKEQADRDIFLKKTEEIKKCTDTKAVILEIYWKNSVVVKTKSRPRNDGTKLIQG